MIQTGKQNTMVNNMFVQFVVGATNINQAY